ncbi:MAG: replication-associated recombination protein A, partial [Bacteroidetes bacterium]|nr:replication-associated recombination protein A [Bacteroidota bacterium]
ATASKSNAAYLAIDKALAAVDQQGDLPVPLHLRNAPTRMMKDMGFGANYQYVHNHEGNFAEQNYLPEQSRGTKFFEPGNNAKEEEMRRMLQQLWKDHYQY